MIDDSALFIVSFFIRHVYGRVRLFNWVHMIERARMGAYFWDSSWCILWVRVWFAHSFFCERCERPFFIISGSLLYPSFRLFRMWLLSMLWCRVTITHFSISSPSSIFILSLRFTPLHLISFFSHSIWCLTWVQHPHFISFLFDATIHFTTHKDIYWILVSWIQTKSTLCVLMKDFSTILLLHSLAPLTFQDKILNFMSPL